MRLITRRGVVLIWLLVLPSTGCLFRSRKVEQPFNYADIQTATQQELVDYINAQAAAIQTLQATVDIDTTVGGVKKGKVTDYQQIRGYVLARKPAMLRMIGLMPVVRNTAFDMVSDGNEFKLWIPAKNRFVVGKNSATAHNPQQPLENVKPKAIYESLLLPRIDPETEIAVMENDTEIPAEVKKNTIVRADYVIDVIVKAGPGWRLARKVIFSRADLLPHRQLLYDENGNVATNATYRGYKKDEHGVNYPWQIEISRPQEEYNITLSLVKLDVNQPLADDKFLLPEPVGVQVVHLDQPQADGDAIPPGDPKR
jgi:outer membrane lipoprotein-sorting protein